MRRIYFLLPDVEVARKVVDELLLARIDEHHIHVIAKEGTAMMDLPKASLAQKSDVVTALERGIAVGGATGLLAGVVAVSFPPAGLVLGGGALLGIALAGTGFGAFMSTMIGVSAPNSRHKQFEDAIQQGELLMLVDVPKARVNEIETMVKQHHSDVDIEGTEPTIPVFP
ncbi:MAG: hypothetical protein BMS9Abin25_1015 [Gammaproteobacteria bacterium]|nr:MAG: hypothetical protein BMS9Abin25_1015 [Gammaproteobacteria bacterium]